MKTTQKVLSLLTLLSALAPAWGNAQTANVPKYVNFQAVLRDDSGNLISDGFIDLEFKILDQDGDELYYELQPGVQVVRSAVNVLIGEGVEPGSSPSAPTGGIPFDSLNPAGGTKFLQMKVGTNLPSDNMELGSVPYAVYAQTALGLSPDIPASAIPGSIATDDELAAAIEQERNDRIVGDANDLTTTTIFGGDVTGTYDNLQLGSNSVTSSEIATGAVGSAEISDASITTNDLNSSSFNTWDQNSSDDLTTSTSFSGDVSGQYNNLQIGTGVVGANEVDGISTRSVGLTPFAFGSFSSPDNGCSLIQGYNLGNGTVTVSGVDCLSKDQGCSIPFTSPPGSGTYIVIVSNNEGQNGTDDNPATCEKLAGSFTASGGPSNAKFDVIIFKP